MKDNSTVDVAVIIPAYNAADCIGQALESVFAQTCQPRLTNYANKPGDLQGGASVT